MYVYLCIHMLVGHLTWNMCAIVNAPSSTYSTAFILEISIRPFSVDTDYSTQKALHILKWSS